MRCFLFAIHVLIAFPAFTQAVALEELFGIYNQNDVQWQTTQQSYFKEKNARVISAAPIPDLNLVGTLGQNWQITAGPGDFLKVLDEPFSLPAEVKLSVMIPVLDPNQAIEFAGWGLKNQWKEALWEDFKAEKFALFLMQLTELLKAQELYQLRSEVAGSYQELATMSARKLTMGAGGAKEVLAAKITSQRAAVSAQQSLQTVKTQRTVLGLQVSDYITNQGRQDSWVHAWGWAELLPQLGWDVGKKNAAQPEGLSDDLPTPAVSVLELILAESLKGDLFAAKQPAWPKIDVYGNAGYLADNWNGDLTAGEVTAQLGLRFSWPILSQDSFSTSKIQKIIAIENRAFVFDIEKRRSVQELNKAAENYLEAHKIGLSRKETKISADRFAMLLQSEMQAGTISLDKVLEGWQLVYSVQEEEIMAQWDEIQAAISYLRLSKRLKIPGSKL